MSKNLQIEALSSRTPETPDELVNILDRSFDPQPNRSLVVLPEYFIDGANLYDGTTMQDPKISALVNYAKTKRAHVVTGVVERIVNGDKYIAGLMVCPNGTFRKQRKLTPTPFEAASGIKPGSGETQAFSLDDGLGKIAIAMCFEVFSRHEQLGGLHDDIDVIVNPRGFDLDDPNFGQLSQKWLLGNRNLAMMGKCYVAGATGSLGGSGAMAEIINFEGDVVQQTLQPDETMKADADLDLLAAYRRGEYVSATVPLF